MPFISMLPRQLAREALVLTRRLEYLKSIFTDEHSKLEVLSDVSDIQDFIYHYFDAYDTTVSQFVVKYERNQLKKVIGESDDSK